MEAVKEKPKNKQKKKKAKENAPEIAKPDINEEDDVFISLEPQNVDVGIEKNIYHNDEVVTETSSNLNSANVQELIFPSNKEGVEQNKLISKHLENQQLLVNSSGEQIIIKDSVKIEQSQDTYQKLLQTNKEIIKSIKLSEIALSQTNIKSEMTNQASTTKNHEVRIIKAYAESQLSALYANRELEVVKEFTSQFVEAELKGIAVKRHPLYELLETYLQSRNKMMGNSMEIEQLRQEYKDTYPNVWTLETAQVTGRGECRDGNSVNISHSYNNATFHRSMFQSVGRILTSLRKAVTEGHVLYSYLVEISKMQIELYLQTLITNCLHSCNIDQNSPICLISNSSTAQLEPILCELRLCISVLFAFQRRLIRDLQFIKESREWLGRLIAILLRLSNWQDHLFILNHILRCPAGVGMWAAHFVQIPLPERLQDSPFSNYEVNHAMAILSVILMPIEKRVQFLEQLAQSKENSEDLLWVIVDSDGEEDEEPSGTSLRENDLVQLLNQLPIDNLFRVTMLIRHFDGQDYYDPYGVTEDHILRFLAFSTVLLKILHQGLCAYNMPRYQQFSKRLCRFIRHIVQYTTDQWEQFQSGQRLEDTAMFERLQVEYDAFFLRATHYLYSSQKIGSWQFLAIVPFHLTSIKTLWRIFYLLHDNDRSVDVILDPTDGTDFKEKLWDESLRLQFEEKLSLLDDAESYYLLNTFANMILARTEVDIEFIKAATMDLLEIGYVSEATQENCCKNARILLTHITSNYPFILSDILLCIKEKFNQIGNLSLYLFEELPLSVWLPTEDDMEIIASWLTQNVITTDESRLARMILSRLNWGLTEEGLLFLPYDFHFKVALLLAQVVEQEVGYLQWAWQTAFRLRLHFTDKGFTDLKRVSELDNLNIINKGVREQKPFFCFLSLMMSTWGHLVPLVCSKGLGLLENLLTNQRYDAVLFALHLIVPLFLNCQESLINNEKFQNILVALLNVDKTYINMAKSLMLAQNGILEQFGNMIECQIFNYKWYNLDSPRCLVRLWMNSLVSVPNWNKDFGVLHLLDIILKTAFFHADATEAAIHILRELIQCSTPQESNTSIFSIFKWASQSTLPQGSLLMSPSLPSCVWLAYILINLEHDEREKQTGLWREILTQLKNQKGKVNVDAAIKKATSLLKVPSFTSSSLCIYRWAHQALDTPVDHPLLPLLWQKFFLLFLIRIPVSAAGDRACLGEKFFDGIINLGLLKRLKKKLQETIDFYQKKTENCDNDASSKKLFYDNCQKLFKGYQLWLEEPQLQEANLYLPGLPPQYRPQLLALIIQGNAVPWLEYVDYDAVKLEQQKSIKAWRILVYREKTNVNQPLLKAGRRPESTNPIERILKRLTSYDKPREAPPIVKPAPVIPVLDINEKTSVIKMLEGHFNTLQQFSHNHTLRLSEYKALDSAYKELVPQLYRSITFKMKKQVYCKGGGGHTVCQGPATIILEFLEAKIVEHINHGIETNRNNFELTLGKSMQAPAQTLCISSVTIQNVIDTLQARLKSNPKFAEMGVELFYHILSLLNEEINGYPPTKQFLTSCLDKLGHYFICGIEYETPKLLNKILEKPNFVSLLTPHFSPINAGTTNFLHMYLTISGDINQRYDVILPLLSKFDILNWLTNKQPKLSQRTQFIDHVVKGLSSLCFTPPTEASMLHEVFRKHLLCMFEYQFPEHYGDVLMTLLKMSNGGTESVAINVWMDILNSLSKPIKFKTSGSMRDQLRQYAQQQQMLSYQELVETARSLATHFSKERLQYGLYGLYPKYRNYMEVFVLLIGMTGHALIISSLNIHQGVLGDKLCETIWPYLRDMFSPWILPYWMQNVKDNMATWMQQLTDDRAVLLPWIPADGPYAQKFVHMMFECVQFIIHTLPACHNIMSFIWHWYVTNFAHASVKEHVLNVIHASFFALPWHNFWPLVGDLELMLKVVEQYLPECHVFLGHVFMQVSWNNWMAHVSSSANASIIIRVHHCLLNLLVKLSNEPNVRSNHGDKAKSILVQAESFNWDVLEPGMYQQIVDWYVMSCDPLVLFLSDPLDLDYRVLHFLKVVAHYDRFLENNSTNLLLKRHIYVRSYVKLISVLCSRHKSTIVNKMDQINSVINFNLNHIESVVKTEEEFGVLLNEMFGLLNIDNIKNTAVTSFEQWISAKSADNVIIKAVLFTLGPAVSDSEISAVLYEATINSYFYNNSSQNLEFSWRYLVSLIKPFPPRQAKLEQVLISKGKLLTLHALLFQKIATCNDIISLLNTILQWLTDIKINSSIEDKLPLLWSQILYLTEIQCSINQVSASSIIYKFAQLLLQSASEKSVSGWGKGLLGAIGIVKQDSSSLKFRFLCKALAGYLLAQLPDTKGEPQIVRNTANAPAVVGQPGGNTECVKVLLNLDFGQAQGEIKACAEFALKQIQDRNNSLHNSRKFLSQLVTQLYTKPYLKDIDKC